MAEMRDVRDGARLSIGDPALAEYFSYGSRVLAGVEVNEGTAIGLTAVYRAVSIIAGTIAGLRLHAYRVVDEEHQPVSTFIDRPSGPNGPYTQFEWLELVMVHLLLHGNAYLQHVYNAAGAIVGLMPIPPAAVSVRPIRNAEELANYGGAAGTARKWFEVQQVDGSRRTFTCDDLTHITALSTDGIRGLSPIEAHRQALGTGIAGDRAAARLFGSGMLLGGIVSADEDLDPEDAREAFAAIQDKMLGADHAGEVRFTNARLKFQPWTMPAVDAQFIESRVHQIEEVARIFGIPPHLLGQTEKQTSWGTGVAEQNRGLSIFTLKGWTERIEQRLSELLTRPVVCEFDYTDLLKPAPEVLIPLLISQVDAGLITNEEARRELGRPPLPGTTPAPAELEPSDATGVEMAS